MTAMTYRAKFCRRNKCTPKQFETAFVKFMKTNPDEKRIREFARKWGITIHSGLGDSKTEAILSVNIAAIKVMARNESEASAAIREILGY